MKYDLKNYLAAAAVLAVFLWLGGEARGETVEELKRNGGYQSLMEAFRQERIAEGGVTEKPVVAETRYNLENKLTANDGTFDDNFGVSVALSGNTAVVGAWHDDTGANVDQGSAYVFVRSSAGTWSFQEKLLAADGAGGDNFGFSVAIANATGTPAQTVIMVGAFGDDTGANNNQGAVYVFVRSPTGTVWSSGGKLTASDGAANDAFGNSVALTGSYAIIGANGDDVNGDLDAGSAYIFVRNGTVWEESQKLASSFPLPDRNFGWSVDISGNYAVVGNNQTGTEAGAVEVFERLTTGNTWIHVDRITGGGKFGSSVAINGDTFVAGSPFTNAIATDDGAARVYRRVNGVWESERILHASDAASGDNFGWSVDISGDTLIVGALNDNNNGAVSQGSAYVFRRSGTNWTQHQKILDATGEIGDRFGSSVALSSDTAIIGAFNEDVGSIGQQGSASVFNFVDAAAPFDFDGDGKTDIGIFRQSSGEWWINRSSNSTGYALQFGAASDRLAPVDFTGDGKTDVAIWRPSSGEWFVLRSENNSFYSFPFGANGDTPAPADYDADGKADAAVFRPSTNTWYIMKSGGGTDILGFGSANDKPVPADYDGDGKADLAIFRPNGASGAEWWIRRSTNASIFALTFGVSTDKAVPGDYTGDGKADIAFWRPSNGNWFVLRSEDFSFYSFPFGAAGDAPAAGDYDGDGKMDAAVFRPSNSTWYVNKSTGGSLIQTFGSAGDIPIQSAFIP